MKIGFTGTRKGMTEQQRAELVRMLQAYKPAEFHHGDCVGADEEAHRLVAKSTKIIIHPPRDQRYRACMTADKVHVPKEYLERNHDIVHDTELLIATPKEKAEKLRSGTWATIRYAKSIGRTVIVIFPDGGIG